MKNLIYTLSVILPGFAFGQVFIPASTSLSAAKDTDIVIQTFSNITNNSTFDFSDVNLAVDLNGATQSITGNLFLEGLSITGDGTKTINGNITVTNKLLFKKGILKPATTGKLLFTGPADGIGGGDNGSFYDGMFFNIGGGRRVFPVGIAVGRSTYTPLIFDDIADSQAEIGIQVINTSALLTPDTTTLISVNNDRYWKIMGDPLLINSRVGISLNGLETYLATEGSPAVVQAYSIGEQVENLKLSSLNESSVVSQDRVTAPILTVGMEKKIVVKVHDLITPYNPTSLNAKLTIENIGRFDSNKVTLLDRYGVLVHQWNNYTNDINYDFSKLGPGNYICVVEYGNSGETSKVIQQMVTVLKTR